LLFRVATFLDPRYEGKMMNIYTHFTNEIKKIIRELDAEIPQSQEIPLDKIVVEPAKDPTHGDLATNAAMILSKPTGKPPHQLAHLLVDKIKQLPSVTKAEVAGPGFINISLQDAYWIEQLKEILKEGNAYGSASVGQGQSVNVEYVSVNPTGPMHIGHCRGAVVGDVLASLLEKAGYKVSREFYVNDAGGQANELARSTYKRYLEALNLPAPEIGAYGGEYLIPVGKELATKVGNKYVGLEEAEWLQPVRSFAIEKMLTLIKYDLRALNIHQEIFSSEYEMVKDGNVDKALNTLQTKGLIYDGILEKPKGKEIDDWEPREQTLFKATSFNDDVDRPLKKSDGSWTYFASDIAYHFMKFNRGTPILVNVWGADHGGYVKRITAAVNAITDGKAEVHCILCQMVRFIDQGEILKMSKRKGTFITVREALDKVGLDAIRFMMVSRNSDAPLDFDFAKVVEQTKENPVFYVQYAYARCHSIKRHIEEQFPDVDLNSHTLSTLTLEDLAQEEYINLIKKLVSWPRLIEQAARAFEPHRVTYYLTELAADFHGLWTQGKDAYNLRFIDPQNAKKTQIHFALVQAVATVLESGFKILGITAKESM
jgi:arginyl-tRNA synthetase